MGPVNSFLLRDGRKVDVYEMSESIQFIFDNFKVGSAVGFRIPLDNIGACGSHPVMKEDNIIFLTVWLKCFEFTDLNYSGKGVRLSRVMIQ